MSSFIRCPSCAMCIGKYFEFVQLAKKAYNEEYVDKKYAEYDVEKMIFKANVLPSLEEIFIAIGIDNRCCRQHMTTVESFDKMYK